MTIPEKFNNAFDRLGRILLWGILAIGIVLRLIIWFQDRNLIIDEANIVRNLSERGFADLILPLKYEQYAPPVFLWIEELLSQILGYGEKALKIYPMVCGIASLFVFRKLMKELVAEPAIWLGMALLAFSPYLIEYSATLKQYMPDAFVVLLLLLFALKKDMLTMPRGKFLLFWSVAGVLAILSSMPAVFALAGIGFYYCYLRFRAKQWGHLTTLMILGAVWLGAFAIYYFKILKPQIESDYLQGYHFDYFLYATPGNDAEWQHNWTRLHEIVCNAAGWGRNFWFSLVFIVIGIAGMVRKRPDALILVLSPILLTLIAAALNQYSLIMRLTLFLLPLLVILYTYGFATLWQLRWPPVKLALLAVGGMLILGFNRFELFRSAYGFQEITEGMDYLLSKGASGDQLYIHDASVPTYIYYTELYPEKGRYQRLSGAHRLTWDSDYTQVTKDLKDTTYFLYTGGFPDGERDKRIQQIEQNMRQVDYFRKNDWYVYVYTYVPKTAADSSAR